jgi:hypothetical protein
MSALPLSLPSLPAWAKAAVDRLIQGTPTATDALWARPESLMERASLKPDPWQRTLLRSRSERMLLLCSRQAGKSQTAAALALVTALRTPGALVLLLSPTERQSGELFRDKVMRLYHDAGRPVKAARETALQLDLANGSRIVSLPGKEGTVRGFSGVALLVIDEASRVPDPLYLAVRPMLAVSRGRLLCLSTPAGKRGFFYQEWSDEAAPWQRVRITADQCPRIPADFLEAERLALGPRWFAQEYLCSFEDAVGAVFTSEDIHAALSDDVAPLF